MSENEFKELQYNAAMQYLTKKREDVTIDLQSCIFYATFFIFRN